MSIPFASEEEMRKAADTRLVVNTGRPEITCTWMAVPARGGDARFGSATEPALRPRAPPLFCEPPLLPPPLAGSAHHNVGAGAAGYGDGLKVTSGSQRVAGYCQAGC